MAALTYESFTLREFEKAIAHVEAESLGLINGEYTFRIFLDGQSSLMIRSTVNAQRVSKPSNKDSIRVWLVDGNDKPLGSKIKRGINRTKDWQSRLNDKMIYLTMRRELVGDCLKCGKPIGAFKLKKDKNNLLAKCWDCNNSLGLLSEIKPGTAYFSKISHGETIQIEDKPKDNEISAADFIAEMVEVDNKAETPKSNTGFELSQYQKDIFEFVENSNSNGIVNAVAGSGKTTTNVMALELLPKTTKSIYAAFNKHIERDIATKAPQYVKVSTFHSWGLGNIRQNGSRLKINQYKLYDIIDNLRLKDNNYELKQSVSKLVSLLKSGLLEPTQKNILRLADDFCIDIELLLFQILLR